MTAEERLEWLIGRIEQGIGPTPDVLSRVTLIYGSLTGFVIHDAAQMIAAGDHALANDMISLMSQRLSAHAAVLVAQRPDLKDVLRRFVEGPQADEAVVRVTPSQALRPEELLELGVIDDIEDAPISKPIGKMRWFAYGTQVPACMGCGAPAVAVLVGMPEGKCEMVSSSMCERCLNEDIEIARNDPDLYAIGNLMYVHHDAIADPPQDTGKQRTDDWDAVTADGLEAT